MGRVLITSGALLIVLTWLAVPALAQESAALKRIRIGMPNRGANPGFNVRTSSRILPRPGTLCRTDRHAAVDLDTDADGRRFGFFNGAFIRCARGCKRFASTAGDDLTVGQDFTLVVRPEIRRVEDLKGKTLAISGGIGEFTDSPPA